MFFFDVFVCFSGSGSQQRPKLSHMRPMLSHMRPMLSHMRPVLSHIRPMLSYIRPMLSHIRLSTQTCWVHRALAPYRNSRNSLSGRVQRLSKHQYMD